MKFALISHYNIEHRLYMLRRFSSGMNPLKYQQKTGIENHTRQATFRRENLSLAGCSSAEPASVSVQQDKIQNEKLYLQPALLHE